MNSKTGSRPEKTTRKTGQKSGKKGPGKVPKGKTNGASRKGHKSKGVNGINGHSARVKVEDKLGDEQITRLATGVPVDASSPNEVGFSCLLHGDVHSSFEARRPYRKDGRD